MATRVSAFPRSARKACAPICCWEKNSSAAQFLKEGAIDPDQVADDVVKAMAEEKFLILPHPEAGKYFQNKATDYDRWIRSMRKMLQAEKAFNSKATRQ